MGSDFDRCLAITLKWEGGNDDDSRDPGGRTSRGITAEDWAEWRQTHPGLDPDVWKAPQDQIVALYKERYWNALLCDSLPNGPDMVVFDHGVLAGIGTSAKLLQTIVGVDVDGEIGPLTIAAAATFDPVSLVGRLSDERLAYYQGRPGWPVYGHGWTNRVVDVRKEALALAAVAPRPKLVAPAPSPAPAPVSGGTVLQHNTWPTQAEVRAGVLGDPHDTSLHVEVVCPWQLNGGRTHSITIHKMFAASLARCLNYIWEHPTIDKSQAKIAAFGYDVFDGSYVVRPIAGTGTPSMHSYAAAMDWNAAKNPQHAPASKTLFKTEKEQPPNGSLIIWTFEQEDWTCGIRWGAADIDAMHIQGPRIR